MQENSSFISENPLQNAPKEAPKEKATSFLLALGTLVLVVVVTGIFMILSMTTSSATQANSDKIQAIKSEIQTLQADPKNSVAALVANNEIMSSPNLSQLLSAFTNIANAYQVQFQNFSIKNDEIQTNLIAMDTSKDAAQKIIAMMKAFAKAGQQGNFALEPIFSISGDRNTRTTPITFKIVPIKPVSTEAETAETTENPSN